MKKFFAPFFVLVMLAQACTAPAHLHNSGSYQVATRNGDTVTFTAAPGKRYLVLAPPEADTLKPGDHIYLNRVRDSVGMGSRINVLEVRGSKKGQ